MRYEDLDVPRPTRPNISQPKSSYTEAYKQPLQQMASLRLDNNQLARTKGLVTLLATGDPLKKISSANLIVVCGGFSFTVHRIRC